MKKKSCVHYYYDDYGCVDVCRRDGLRNEHLEFNCKNCNDFRNHYSGLKKCPFCGGKPYLRQTYSYKNEWEVMCRKCHARIKASGADETADKWNARK